ncbi:hypothetical protein DTO021D3_55 [Paecilomyces variotii]|nr:hypothetical protein DTO032I3_55 [Paecilomyces variotii]KAJ9282718.1 hypothetical protein DTO021D3_55 [Paecilomyces variotii]KAJ9343963.1 hypothetical protein DTO027B6_3399 [Paecilomyces variotii]KAJ9393754.1 hypothetical protein DTO032I4_525 [Paecilomyces variotii]
MGPFPIRAVIAFHQMNPDLPLHQHGLVFWLIHHLYRDFDLEKGFWNLNQYPRSRDKALSTMKEKILQKLFRACEHFYAPFPNGPSRESGTELIEAVLVWFLEFERSAPIILVKDRQRKVLWWRMRHVFGVDIGLGKDEDDGGNEAAFEFDWPLSNSTTGREEKS